jgi:hypothetical protein
MSRKQESQTKKLGTLKRAAQSVMRLFGRGGDSTAPSGSASRESKSTPMTAAPKGRPVRRETDIPLDQIEAYNPPVTSSKAGFRSNGADHQLDQEFAFGSASEERWNDEDHYTNKSGDPRIGTHRRTYEPGEERVNPSK